MHHFVYEKMGYRRNSKPGSIRPEDILEDMEGNCVEKCVLLALFLESTGYDTMLISVKSLEGNHHMTLQYRYRQGWGDGLVSRLSDFYKTVRTGFDPESMTLHAEKFRGSMWFVADPEMSKYVGDLGSLDYKDYAEPVTRSRFRWCNKPGARYTF